jgi:hypothetical protein
LPRSSSVIGREGAAPSDAPAKPSNWLRSRAWRALVAQVALLLGLAGVALVLEPASFDTLVLTAIELAPLVKSSLFQPRGVAPGFHASIVFASHGKVSCTASTHAGAQSLPRTTWCAFNR